MLWAGREQSWVPEVLHADRECGTGGQGPLVVLGNFCMLCLEVPGQAPELSLRQASGSWDLAAVPPALRSTRPANLLLSVAA